MIRRVVIRSGVIELSDEGSGDAVVLLHGFTGSKESWIDVRETLSAERRVVSVDLPGHGGTRVGAEAFTMEGAAATVLDSLDALGVPRFDLVGYSMGGRLAVFLAARHGGRVRRLILESASAGIAGEAARDERRTADEALAVSLGRDGLEAFVDRWERLPLFASLAALPTAHRERLRRQRLAADPAGLAASLRGMGTGSQPWLGEEVGRLAMPALVLAGERDMKFSGIARELVAAAPKATLAIVAGAGHIPHLERPREFLDHVRAFFAVPETAVPVVTT